MPKVKVDIRRGRTGEQKEQLMDAIHRALVHSFKIPEYDRLQLLNEHDEEQFIIPEGKSEQFTLIEIMMFPGRSLDAKRTLYETITANLEAIGIDKNDIMIILIEPPLDNWGLQGKPASEVDIGFRLDV